RWFSQHYIACCQSSCNLPREYSNRKIPRADAHHYPKWMVGIIIKTLMNQSAVIAQKVYRLTYLCNGIGVGFTSLTNQQTNQKIHFPFHQFGGLLQDFCALCC